MTFRLSLLALSVILLGCSNTNDVLDNVGGVRAADTVPSAESTQRETIWDVFNRNATQEPVKVNRYIWQAALDVLDFLPIESVDPFSGVIVTGYGTPPGGSTAYKATVYVTDPALEARSLRIAMQTKNGPVSAATLEQVENAILSRARQMRKNDGLF